MSESATIVWFRRDLRVADQPALWRAVEREGPVVPVYIWAPDEEGAWPMGAAARWWLHHALVSLDAQLRERGSRLIVKRGPTRDALDALIDETGATAVVWNRRYEPAAIARDKDIKRWLREEKRVEAESFNGSLLFEPWEVQTQSGGPYKVFTPFWNALQKRGDPEPARDAPAKIAAPKRWPGSLAIDALELRPKLDWAESIADVWTPGEPAALAALDRFLGEPVKTYDATRNLPGANLPGAGEQGTSRLSPRLHHGELSPAQVWHATVRFTQDGRRNLSKDDRASAWAFLRELGWRDFAYHILYHFPHTPTKPLVSKYEAFPWVDMRQGRHWLDAWKVGRTGYPMVDAGMRQLWRDGWMHNRVRMVVASFLVKHLRVHWLEGSRWFWDTLVDADLANNTLGWQWAAGCGADAAPYFRIFNPMTQGEKFDGDGAYVREYVPELAGLSGKHLHTPWEANEAQRAKAGVSLDEEARGVKYAHQPSTAPGSYPPPIVDHGEARSAALEALSAVSG